MFVTALGIMPFKDVFWTTPEQPGNPYSEYILMSALTQTDFFFVYLKFAVMAYTVNLQERFLILDGIFSSLYRITLMLNASVRFVSVFKE